MRFFRVVFCLSLIVSFSAINAPALAQSKADKSISDLVDRAAKNANSKQKYNLAYKMKKGQELRWTVEHVASTETQIAGEAEATSSRSQSVKLWKVSSVDSRGNMTFVQVEATAFLVGK